MEPVIFHFNCPLCGAHPGPQSLMDYLDQWRSCPESDFDAFLAMYGRVLSEVYGMRSGPQTKRFHKALDRLLPWFSPTSHPVQIDESQSQGRIFLADCPMCYTTCGPRPNDKYFGVWRQACSVQVANLLYEGGLVIFCVVRQLPAWATPKRLGEIGDLLAYNQAALAATGLLECPFCGRRTTCLYGDGTAGNPHRCRWCRGGSAFVSVRLITTENGAVRLENRGCELPRRLGGDIVPYNVRSRRGRSRGKPQNEG
jgi:hypothetical protein